jgi:hypothetical protein
MWDDEQDIWRERHSIDDDAEPREAPRVSIATHVEAEAGTGTSKVWVVVRAELPTTGDVIDLTIQSSGIQNGPFDDDPDRVTLHLSNPQLLRSIGQALIAIAPHAIEAAKRLGRTRPADAS